jgi:hypothetical protein
VGPLVRDLVHDGPGLRSALDAVAASWTIGSKEDGPALYLAAACLSHLDQCAHAAAQRAPGRTSQRRARGADAGPGAAAVAPLDKY